MGALHNLELPVGRHQEQNVVVKGQAIESDLIIRGERQKKIVVVVSVSLGVKWAVTGFLSRMAMISLIYAPTDPTRGA